ncbi:hypothetical protein L9F63_026328, partial [Diploptera punctata]
VQQWPLRALGADDVEVTVAMCGMNFADLYTRQGLLRERQPPFALGMECAGHVTKVGDNVTHIKVGDRVLCYQHTGDLFREHVVVASSQCFVLPSGMSYEDGAALAANYLTAYFCVLDIGNLRPGQSILIHSCAGGVGWAATQLAHSVGSVTIYGTCSPGKRDAVIQNGVTHPLSHDTYEAELLKLSPQGVDVVIDNKSGSHFSTSQQLLKPLGRAVLIGNMNFMENNSRVVDHWSRLDMSWPLRAACKYISLYSNYFQSLLNSLQQVTSPENDFYGLMRTQIRALVSSLLHGSLDSELSDTTSTLWEPSAPMQSYMFLVIVLLFKIHKVEVKMNFHFLKLICRYHDISFSATKGLAGVFKWLARGFKCPAQCLKSIHATSIMFSVYAEKRNLIESTKEFNWKNRRIGVILR